MSRRIRGAIVSSMAAVATLTAWSGYVQAQVAVGLDLAAPIAPLNAIAVPDVNMLGMLDGAGRQSGADAWPAHSAVDHETGPTDRAAAAWQGAVLGHAGRRRRHPGVRHLPLPCGRGQSSSNQLSPGLKRTGRARMAAHDPGHDA